MKKILIIDDEQESIDVFEMLLKNLNYTVFAIKNPLKAIETIKIYNPDLIILDWMMDAKDGIEVLKEIKSDIEIKEIPIIISSGIRTQSSNLKLALEYGATDLLKKPIDEIEIEARVKSAINIYEYIKQTRIYVDEIHHKEIEISEAKAIYFQNELNKKNREMLVSAVSIFQNKKLVNQIKTEFLTKNEEICEESKLKILKILERFENLSNSFNSDLFERRFIELNDDFYNKLKTEFPTLTSGEQRLCAFLKLGLTIKEIAIINYSSYEAIRKAVYRIRKKLKQNDKIDINLFFQAF